jgi:hypothetical protein
MAQPFMDFWTSRRWTGINGSASSQVTSMDVDGGRSAVSGGGTGKAPMQ